MLQRFTDADIVFIESGGDNLAAAFSPELSELTIYVIDVAAGEKIPRRGGPGITKRTCSSSTRSISRRMSRRPGRDAADMQRMRGAKPYVMSNLRTHEGLARVVAFIETHGLLV